MSAPRPRLDVLVAVALGGIVGATGRYWLEHAIAPAGNGFPLGTLTANVIGSFVLGFVAVAIVDLLPPMRYLRPFLSVGLIGSFTTFSSFAVENVVLVDSGSFGVAALYVPTTLLTGLAAARLGIEAARRLVRRYVSE